MQNLENIFEFLAQAEKLKSTLRFSVTSADRKESSAEHSWRLSLLVFLLWENLKDKIDVNHAIKLAIFHDLPEAIVWDTDAYYVSKDKNWTLKKEKKEEDAMKKLSEILWWDFWKEVFNYWKEYCNWETKEAQFVKALDKIECLNQFCDYWKYIFNESKGFDFMAFYADKHIAKVPKLKPILDITKKKMKKSYKKWWVEWKDEYEKY